MKQALSDFILKLQKDRKVQVMAVVTVVIVVFSFMNGTVRRGGIVRLNVKEGAGGFGEGEAYNDIISRFGNDLDGVKNDVTDIKRTIEDQAQGVQEFEQRTAEIFKKMLERMAEVENSRVVQQTAEPVDVGEDNLAEAPDVGAGDELESFGLEEPAPLPPPPAIPKIAYIGPGDSVRVKLLAGVNAPTDGSPYPVVFKLVSDVYGPDGSTLPLGEARVIAAAQGSIIDQRALFRLTSMNLRMPSGKRVSVQVDGWVVGEDGIRGLKGVLIDPIGKAIAGAGFAAIIDGIGSGLVANNTTQQTNSNGTSTTVIDGNVGQVAAGAGFQSAARTYASLIRERLTGLTPLVQVYSGREATIVFSAPATIPGLFEQLQADQEAQSLD